MTYICNICSARSDSVEFYNGVTSRCKECHKQKVRENRAENADYYRAYDAKRFQDDPRVRARHRRYGQTPEGKASHKKAHQKWMDENPEKRAANVLVNNAVRDGRLIKPKACEHCRAVPARIEGHHPDYTKPLEVTWLCGACHSKIHREATQ